MAARTKKSNTTNPHPVDSATRTCCGGIGDHTAECPPALRFFDTGAEPVDLDPIPEDPADAVIRRIEEFQDTLPDQIHKWTKGTPAPDWMGPRPVWAEDHYDKGDRFLPAECFWQSYDINLPAEFMYGTKSRDKSYRTFGAYRAFLRQGKNERHPHVHVSLGDSTSVFHLKLTLTEVDDLVAALELLADIAKQGMAAEGGDEK